MLLNRKELKAIKKDLIEQLESEIESSQLYLKNWITHGDDVYEGNDNKVEFDGRLTRKETEGKKVYRTGQIIITVLEDKEIEISIQVVLQDEYDMLDDTWVVLNI